MTYKEILELYKKGTLSKEQEEKVKEDIEKHEAISEYLFDAEGLPEFSEEEIFEGCADDTSSDEQKFVKMINKSIRRAFVRLGIVVGVVVLILTLVGTTTLPYIVDAVYYNPAAVVGDFDGIETSRMALDTAVYTELFTPGYSRTKVDVTREGYGRYDICIPQIFSYNGQFTNVFGSVDKGKMTLYSDGLFKLPTSNAFVPADIGINSGYGGTGAAGSVENAKKTLTELDDSDYYVAYVTLDKVMTYDEFVSWSKETGIDPEWCAVCTETEVNGKSEYDANEIIGFNYSVSSNQLAYDKEEYPYLSYFDMTETLTDFDNDTIDAEVMEQHMTSMLRYMSKQEKFLHMAGYVFSEHAFEGLAMNIEENGINIYGFVVVAQRDRLIEISNTQGVYYTYTRPMG